MEKLSNIKIEKMISIIIPIYNSEKWLEKCLQSVRNQTYKNIEVILINDGSSDNSKNICESFVNNDRRFSIFNQKNSGVSKARNYGLSIAKGEFIQFVDSDDWLESNICEMLVKQFTGNEVDLIICGININKDNAIIRSPALPEKVLDIKNSFEDFKYIFPLFSAPWNKLYKRELIGNFFPENISNGEDLIFNTHYLQSVRLAKTINHNLYNVRLDNSDSLNKKIKIDRIKTSMIVYEELKRLLRIKYKDKIENEFIKDFQVNTLYSIIALIIRSKKNATQITKKEIMSIYHENKINEILNLSTKDKKQILLKKILLRPQLFFINKIMILGKLYLDKIIVK